MKTRRLFLLFCTLVVLAGLNLAIAGGQFAGPKDLQVKLGGCCGTDSGSGDRPQVSATEMWTMSKTVNCGECTYLTSTNHHWCVDLSGGCYDGFPYHTNFEFERTVDFYDCAGPIIGVRCGSWEDSGCCGSDDPIEPPCTEGPNELPCQ
ncbi:MAG: hypothetical protein CNCCGFBP_00545 [Fimbriimonadaceae bacterium]|nr:hypothetical protein [Fimbriimonadaceae bacterium]